MMLAPVIKAVRAYDASEWEIFVSEWRKGLEGYYEVKRLGGPGDLGRDVVGLVGPEGCEGEWDNFQCKHYERLLAPPQACEDAGKIIFHAFRKEFRPPRRCVFVAPLGPSTKLRDMLLNPSKFREEVIATWNTRVAARLVDGENHILEGDLEDFVRAYDYSTFRYATIEEILDIHRKTGYWASRFNGLLPPPPPGFTPSIIAASESVYVGQLFDVYSEITNVQIKCEGDLGGHQNCKDDLQKQRVRFYDAEAFSAHYRDQTEPGTVEDFAEQILDAIDPAISGEVTAQGRMTSALTAAGTAIPASVLSPQAKIRVKQGVCHQLANVNRVYWKIRDE